MDRLICQLAAERWLSALTR